MTARPKAAPHPHDRHRKWGGCSPADPIPHPFVHPCEHPGCTKDGGFGFGGSLTKRGRWYCADHKHEGERR